MIQLNIRRLSFIVAFIILLPAGGCAESGSEEAGVETSTVGQSTEMARRHVRVETLILEPTSFEDVIEITGSVEAYHDATISAQGSGTLIYRVDRGAYVGRNGLIAQIDSTLMHASYMQARAQVEVAQAQYDLTADAFARQEPLYQDSIISAIEFESVRAQLNQASGQLSQSKALLAQFREQLDHTRITAPFGGTIETFLADLGEQVVPGTPIARIVDTRQVKVTAGVPERYANDIEVGTRVSLAFAIYGGIERTGTIAFVGKAINASNRTFPVEIRLDNADQALKPEMVARLFISRETFHDVIVIPQDAVPLDEEGHSVFIVVQQGDVQVAERRQVTLGPSYAGNVVVESGLKAGDEVIVLGQYNLTEGDAVEIVNASRTSLAALVGDS